MVKPPLRTKSIGFKVSEEEYAQLDAAAHGSGRSTEPAPPGRDRQPTREAGRDGTAHPGYQRK